MMIQVVGFIGMLGILLAYGLAVQRHWTPQHRFYALLNIGGSLTMALYGWLLGAWAAVTLNLIWLALAVIAYRKGRHGSN